MTKNYRKAKMTVEKPESPWNYKPWWCQPWSILLTGIAIVVGSWQAFKSVWLTVLVAIPIAIWMGFFLILWPRLVMSNQYSTENPDP